jgi:C4-type Zn-finger protein
MGTVLIPKEEVRLPRGLKCPYCGRYGSNHFEVLTGVEANPFMGRIVTVRCDRCKRPGLVQG